MIRFLISVILALTFVVFAEQTRRNPHKGQDLFMTEKGWTRSIFALPYLGRPKEARQALIDDEDLRKKFIIELYVWAIVMFLLGLTQL